MTKENNKKCKWIAPNGQQYDCKPSPVCGDCENNTFSENRQYRIVGSSYADIAEKRIAELEKENAELRKTVTEKNTLIERLNCRISTQCGSNRVTNEKLKARLEQVERQKQEIAELKTQIEEMKCCFNCKHSRTEYEHCRTDKHEKWEIKENEKE